jgi:hypothetical protein
VYVLAAIAAFVIGARFSHRFASVVWRPLDLTYFWVGAAICCGSFLGANIAYRWIFALLAIPLLLRVISVPDRVVTGWSRLTLAAIVISLVAPLRAAPEIFLLKQFVNWSCVLLMVSGGAALLAVTSTSTPLPPRHRGERASSIHPLILEGTRDARRRHDSSPQPDRA